MVSFFKSAGLWYKAKNYCLDSLLSVAVVSNISEKLVNNRFVDHLEWTIFWFLVWLQVFSMLWFSWYTSWVACICNPNTLETTFWNGVGSITIGGSNPSICGWIVWPPVIQLRERSLSKYWDLLLETLKYWVRVQRSQSYVMGRTCLCSLGWRPF